MFLKTFIAIVLAYLAIQLLPALVILAYIAIK